MRRKIQGWALVSGFGVALLTAPVIARQRDDQGFPDYNRLEYAKPLPAPDPSAPAVRSDDMPIRTISDKKPIITTPDSVPVPILRPRLGPDDSEPSMDDMLSNSTAVSTTTTASEK